MKRRRRKIHLSKTEQMYLQVGLIGLVILAWAVGLGWCVVHVLQEGGVL